MLAAAGTAVWFWLHAGPAEPPPKADAVTLAPPPGRSSRRCRSRHPGCAPVAPPPPAFRPVRGHRGRHPGASRLGADPVHPGWQSPRLRRRFPGSRPSGRRAEPLAALIEVRRPRATRSRRCRPRHRHRAQQGDAGDVLLRPQLPRPGLRAFLRAAERDGITLTPEGGGCTNRSCASGPNCRQGGFAIVSVPGIGRGWMPPSPRHPASRTRARAFLHQPRLRRPCRPRLARGVHRAEQRRCAFLQSGAMTRQEGDAETRPWPI